MKKGKGQKLYEKAKKLIPGGTQLLSKRPEMFLPELWPSYFKKAKGIKVWDLDDNQYLDFSYMSVGTNILGYAYDEVDEEVCKAVKNSNMTTLNAPEEVYLAEKLLELHPWADMVRYAKTGGEATTIAIRIARAKTKKDIVLFCGYHGWHDWYLSANLNKEDALSEHLLSGLNPLGVPKGLKNTSFPFRYNDVEGLKSLVDKYKDDIACIIMEPMRNKKPTKEFLDTIHQVKEDLKIPLIVDEITAGFRLTIGGAHKIIGLKPDIAVFGKGISNGYPMAVIIGKSSVMDVAQDTFISSTYWTDRIGLVASLKTIEIVERENVPDYLTKTGEKIENIWTKYSKQYNLPIEIQGFKAITHFSFKLENPLLYKTIFTKLMLEKGFLATTAFYASYSHKDEDVKQYEKAVEETFRQLKKIIENKMENQILSTPICHSGFKRLN